MPSPPALRAPACFLVLALAALACRAPFPLPDPTPQPGSGLIAYLGADGNVYVFDPAAPEPVALTTDAQPDLGRGADIVLYRYPAWSPDGRLLAFAAIRSGEAGTGAALLVSEPGSDTPTELHEIFASEAEAPFYLYWAPDSLSLTFLTSSVRGDSLLLRQAFPDGAETRLLGADQPYYWHWSPDAAQILVHIGGSRSINPAARISLLEPEDARAVELGPAPGGFQAPAWAPDGASFLAMVRTDGPADELARFDREGTRLETFLEAEGLTAFTWSPDGSRIAVRSVAPQGILFGPLLVLDSATGEVAWRGLNDLTLAYFWSPDGSRLAFFHLEGDEGFEALARPALQEEGALLSLSVLEVEKGLVRHLARFAPTAGFLEIVPFFDQYHHSLTIWSPDSAQLVFTGVDESSADAVWLVPADGSEPPKWMVSGGLAIWSWR
ncbi:MAG TPA: hypothetical protein VMN57_03585 [Anaerolineales bacterium]|nr:hypothetical protein [Anaerolineales bacterium]